MGDKVARSLLLASHSSEKASTFCSGLGPPVPRTSVWQPGCVSMPAPCLLPAGNMDAPPVPPPEAVQQQQATAATSAEVVGADKAFVFGSTMASRPRGQQVDVSVRGGGGQGNKLTSR